MKKKRGDEEKGCKYNGGYLVAPISNYSIKLSRSPQPDAQPDFALDKIDRASFLLYFNMSMAVCFGDTQRNFFFSSSALLVYVARSIYLSISIGARNSQQALWLRLLWPHRHSLTPIWLWHHFPCFHLTASTSVIKMKAFVVAWSTRYDRTVSKAHPSAY